MKERIFLFLLAILLASGSVALAGRPRIAKAVTAPVALPAFEQEAARALPGNMFKHPKKVADSTFNIGTSWYNYMWNSGGPRHVEYFNGITYLVWVTRSPESAGGTPEIVYSSFDGTTWFGPQAVEPALTQGTSSSGISVWRGGVASGRVGIGVGWNVSGTSYYGIEASPGGGSFTTHPIDGNRDLQVTNLDSLGTLLENNSWGRTNYAVELSTNFGATWAVLDSNLLRYSFGGQTIGCLEPSVEVSAGGSIYMMVTLTGKDYVPPLGSSPADSSNQWGYFKSTDDGHSWRYLRILSDGMQYDPNRYSLFTNFAQYDMVVDKFDNVHAVINGYHFISLDPGIDTIFQNGFDVVYWDATNGFKSLVDFNRNDTVIVNAPQSRFGSGIGGNRYGCSYPSIAETPDGKFILCTWCQPNWTSAGIDTNDAGFITSNVWYNASYDGGATWAVARPLNNERGVIQAFSSQAHDVQFVPGPPDYLVARILYLDIPNEAGAQTGTAPPAGNMAYQDLHIWVNGVSGPNSDVPMKFALEQNFPNPCNPSSEIRYSISEIRYVRLAVYDLLGREVVTLVNEVKQPGTYTVEFDGSKLASGVYFYRLQAGEFVQARKLLLLK